MGTGNCRIQIATLLGLFIIGLVLFPLGALAQSGCTGDPCVFYTPTATGTPTPLPTAGAGTPTPVPWPSAVPFPNPDFIAPTSIPSFAFPSVPSPLDIEMPDMLPYFAGGLVLTAPNPITLSSISFPTTDTAEVAIEPITTSLFISYSRPLTLDFSSGATGTTGTGSVDLGAVPTDTTNFINAVVSYTGWLSGQGALLNSTRSLTIASAPDWYAPPLPRPMADVGYTFELMRGDVDNAEVRYSVTTWAWLAGYIVSLPFQFVKLLYQLAEVLGPIGLFITWLLIMVPVVLFFKLLFLIKNLIVKLFNFFLSIIDFILSLIGFMIKLFV